MTPRNQGKEEFNLLAETYQPPRPILRNIIAAFVVGGLICVVAQIILDYLSVRCRRIRLPR